MQFVFVLLVAIFGLLGSASAQSCARITASDLGNSDMASNTGLIAEILRINSGADVTTPVLLHNFHIVCEGVAVTRDMFREVSVVANYTFSAITRTSQFEFSCGTMNVWTVQVSGSTSDTVTTPADATFTTSPNSNCSQCLSTRRSGSSSDPINHCSACNSGCMGLGQCTSIFSCCNYYNDGKCVALCPSPRSPQSDNTCGCAPGLTGSQCDITINFCDPNPCMNSGACSSSSSGFSCDCAPGFTGPQCDIAIDFCDPNPCMNSGTCSSSSTGFSCDCAPRFTGPRCDIAIDFCDPNPCMNGGTCEQPSNVGFTCSCPMGFDSDRCQNDINECNISPSLCLNNGRCQNTRGSYMCECVGSWEGDDCGRCGIRNCTLCSSSETTCTQCAVGYVLNADNTMCSLGQTCEQTCRRGFCIEGNCVCEDGFVGPNCEFECTLNFCEQCFSNNTGCERCDNGFVQDQNNLCVRDTSSQFELEDIELIAIIVGSIIAGIMVMTLCVCCVVCLSKVIWKRRPINPLPRNLTDGRQHTRSHTETKQMTMINDEVVMEDGYTEDEAYEEEDGGLTLF